MRSLNQTPLHQCEGRLRIVVRFEHRLYRGADLDLLIRIAQQIPDQADIAVIRQFSF
jgi:hypothetical protein